MPDNQFVRTLEKEGNRAVAKYLQVILNEIRKLQEEVAELKRRSAAKSSSGGAGGSGINVTASSGSTPPNGTAGK